MKNYLSVTKHHRIFWFLFAIASALLVGLSTRLIFDIWLGLYRDHSLSAAGLISLFNDRASIVVGFTAAAILLGSALYAFLYCSSIVILSYPKMFLSRTAVGTSRLLSALPTVYLGGAVYSIFGAANVDTTLLRYAILGLALIASGLPTGLNIAASSLIENRHPEAFAARCLGFDRISVWRGPLRGKLRRILAVALAVSVTRIFVEGAVVIGAFQTTRASLVGKAPVGDLVAQIYQSVSATSNIYLTLILLLIVILARAWAIGVFTWTRS